MAIARGAAFAIFLMAGLAAGGAFYFHERGSGQTAASQTQNVVLIYVGADDCAPCKAWQRDRRNDLAKFPEIEFREVKSPKLFEILSDAYWPGDLRAYRRQIAKGAGVPLWLVVRNGEVVRQAWGISKWDEAIVPQLHAMVH